MIKEPANHQRKLIDNETGLTMQGLIIFMVCLFAGLGLLVYLLYSGEKAAYEITIKHDLLSFAKIERLYLAGKNQYIGKIDDVISNSPATPSTLSLEDFLPSQGVIITIISVDPFIVQGRHQDSASLFEYNFSTDAITDIKGARND